MGSLEPKKIGISASPFRSGPLVAFAAATDLSYALLALWTPPAAQPLLRWWVQHRYLKLAPAYDAYIARHATTYGAALIAALERVPGTPQHILDVSSGTGYAAETLGRRYPQAQVIACDLSFAMAQHAQRRIRPGRVVCADGGCLPFADRTFDLVVLQNAPPALGELARLVDIAGWLVLAFSTGATVPGWIRARLDRRLQTLGFGDRTWGRVGDGLFVATSRGSVGGQ